MIRKLIDFKATFDFFDKKSVKAKQAEKPKPKTNKSSSKLFSHPNN